MVLGSISEFEASRSGGLHTLRLRPQNLSQFQLQTSRSFCLNYASDNTLSALKALKNVLPTHSFAIWSISYSKNPWSLANFYRFRVPIPFVTALATHDRVDLNLNFTCSSTRFYIVTTIASSVSPWSPANFNALRSLPKSLR